MCKRIISIFLTMIITICCTGVLSVFCSAAESATIFTKNTTETMWKFTRVRSAKDLKQFDWNTYDGSSEKSSYIYEHLAFVCFPAFQCAAVDVDDSELYESLYFINGFDTAYFSSGKSWENFYKLKLNKVKDIYKDFDFNQDVFYSNDVDLLPQIFKVGEQSDKTKTFYGTQFGFRVHNSSKYIFLNNRRYCDNQWLKYDNAHNCPGFMDNPWAYSNSGAWILGFRDNCNLDDSIYHGEPDACKIVGGVVADRWHTTKELVDNEYYELDSLSMLFEYFQTGNTLQVYDRFGFDETNDGTNAYIWIGEKVPVSTVNSAVTVKSGTVAETEYVTFIGDDAVITVEPGAVLDISMPTFCSGKIYNYGTVNVRDDATLNMTYKDSSGMMMNKYSNNTYSGTGKKFEGNFSIADGASLAINSGSITNEANTMYLKGTVDFVHMLMDGGRENTMMTFKNGAELFGYNKAKLIVNDGYRLTDLIKIDSKSMKIGNFNSIPVTKSDYHTDSKFLVKQ